jgi:hypothetical protein
MCKAYRESIIKTQGQLLKPTTKLNIDNGVLAKIREIGVIITVKNGLEFDKELLKKFKSPSTCHTKKSA